MSDRRIALLDRRFRAGGPTVREIAAALETERRTATRRAAEIRTAAYGGPFRDRIDTPADPWGDARSSREGSR